MSQVKIKRLSRVVDVTITTATATSTTLRMDDMSIAVVNVGTIATAAAKFQVWGNTTDTGAFSRLYTAAGAAADITLAPSLTVGTSYALPEAAAALPYVKIVADTAAAACAAQVVIKS